MTGKGKEGEDWRRGNIVMREDKRAMMRKGESMDYARD